MRLRK